MTADFVVIGIDPGDSTGVAALRNGGNLIYAGQAEPSQAMLALDVIIQRLLGRDEIMIAIERYTSAVGSKIRTHQPTAQRVIGVVQAMADRYQIPHVMQGAADAWAVASNETLRKLGLFQTRQDVDALDANDANMAMRHAILLMSHRYASVFDTMIKSADL